MNGFAVNFLRKAIITPMSFQTHMALKSRMRQSYITHTLSLMAMYSLMFLLQQYAGTWEQNINILPLKHFCTNSFTLWNQMQWHVHKGMPSIIRQIQHFRRPWNILLGSEKKSEVCNSVCTVREVKYMQICILYQHVSTLWTLAQSTGVTTEKS